MTVIKNLSFSDKDVKTYQGKPKTNLQQKIDQLFQIYHVDLNKAFPSLALRMNQREPDIQHKHQDYSTTDPWLHLHQIVQMFDDREDPLQMQLKTKIWNHNQSLYLTLESGLLVCMITIKFLYIKSLERRFQC